VDFFIGGFMDKTLLGIFIGSGTTLLGVGLTSLFNYLTKRKELKHNEHLKELDLKDREKERKFKVEEKMIEKSIEAHMEAYNRLDRVFDYVNSFYTADGRLVMPDEKRTELYDMLLEFGDWKSSNGFLLERKVCDQLGTAVGLARRVLKNGAKLSLPQMDIWKETWKAVHELRTALESISKEYNPLYDLNIKPPEI
jgi:hypothetical protein